MTTTATLAQTHRTPRSVAAPRIVVGVDGSEQAQEALKWAIERARSSGEQVVPVYVFNSVPPAEFGGFGAPFIGPMVSAEELTTAADAHLAASLAAVDADGVGIEPRTVDALSTVTGLVKAAEGASMLVLGVHRRHWMDGAIGSTARACLKHAPCAVVVVPAPAAHNETATAGTP